MGLLKGARPSPAIVIAILALVAGVTGAAVAQPTAKKAVTKKKVKKIAKKQAIKQINELAPGLSVAGAINATNADNAANANALQGKPASAFASKTSEPYREIDTPGQPPFQNAWSNNGAGFSTAAFYKDSQGVVHLKGTLLTSADATVAFTLPTGYRPSQGLSMPVGSLENAGAAGGGFLVIRANGEVLPDCAGGTTCHAGMDGLTFRAQQ
jgi:hypothetical protein